MLLTASILRLQRWSDDGHVRYLAWPPDLNTARAIAKDLLNGATDQVILAKARQLTVDVLVCWMTHFSWSARRLLGADVVIGRSAPVLCQVNLLAEYLAAHCGLSTDPKGSDHVGS